MFEEASGEVDAFSPVKLQHKLRNNRTADKRGKKENNTKTQQRPACETGEGQSKLNLLLENLKKARWRKKKKIISGCWSIGELQPTGIYSADRLTRPNPQHVAAGCRAFRSHCALRSEHVGVMDEDSHPRGFKVILNDDGTRESDEFKIWAEKLQETQRKSLQNTTEACIK